MKLRKDLSLAKNRKAVSAVISNMLLIAAVIAVGLVAVAFSQYTSASYQKQYGTEINTNIQQMKEKVAFEYVIYDSSTKYLKATIINCGTANEVTVTSVRVNGFAISSTDFTFGRLRAGNEPYLNKGDEGLVSINLGGSTVPFSLRDLSSYTVSITTGRKSSFVGTT